MNFSKNSGKKKAAAAAVVCFVAAIAITGTYTFNDYKKSQDEKEIAMAEEKEVTNEERLEDTPEDTPVDSEMITNEAETSGGDDEKEEVKEEVKEIVEDTAKVSVNNAANVNFTDESLILWPASGVLLMDYSMDQTVYFKTLDQYKYNPAIVIAAAENDQVIAGAAGLVKSIDHTAQTGTTVNVDFGNGYEAFYGQLQNVAVKTGDYVEATTTLGYVAEPTKYYSSEGTNVYFEMRKDGQPVNPKDYLTDYAE